MWGKLFVAFLMVFSVSLMDSVWKQEFKVSFSKV